MKKHFIMFVIIVCNIVCSQNKNIAIKFSNSIINNVENEKIYTIFIRKDTLKQRERFEFFSLQLDDVKKRMTSKKCTVYSYHDAYNKKLMDYTFINENGDNV
ncbi:MULTISPECIES: hypothetical protein [unclassified Flavobacterium]|uniref:hypothetical protein n=1 Tax=unclassified Flavobacterium TaxID=196869 RepID=UPI00086D30C6|nr:MULTISPECIES: hypothetical protein [unclassified Flavobacterium]MBN9284687.1 hypothetical protein [Flavobacterium sp.]ODS86876.1 MAG: hypothetical protein ABS44_12675 [Chryseobacterium sp. SCN 40-13]OJV72568.1 MAG: hypothetical protein BGO42_05640 [Flavobacterium sp. 40-81]